MNRYSQITFKIVASLMLINFFLFAYGFKRPDFFELFWLYSIAFLGFIYFLSHQKEKNQLLRLLLLSILFRFIFILALPNLSDDYLRFIWDGSMLRTGLNPFAYAPIEAAGKPPMLQLETSQYLLHEMYSKINYTCYPPLNQFFFMLSTLLFPHSITGSVVIMRLIIIAGDIGIIWIGMKLMKQWKINPANILYFALNPFIIIELTGNLHFEGVMIFFFLTAIYLFTRHQWIGSAILYGLSVSVKLITLMLLPFLFRKLGRKKFLFYAMISAGTFLLLFVPFLSKEVIMKFWDSLDLYFNKFEFNASIYYIVRTIGYEVKGWNIIQTAGPVLTTLAGLSILLLAVFQKKQDWPSILKAMLFAITIYYLLAMIVHPWYLTTLVVLSMFTRFRYPVIWTYLIFLTYYTYRASVYDENLWLVGIEYIIVLSFMLYELLRKNKQPLLPFF